MRLSYVLVSRNRKETLLRTLCWLEGVTPLPRDQWEVWVVDNASVDGSADAVAELFPEVHLIRNIRDEGDIAINHALLESTGRYVILLDDDSYPADDSTVLRGLEYMEQNPQAGALVGKIIQLNGLAQGPELPSVFMHGATFLRREALDRTGGFSPEFSPRADEYDLSFRIWQNGYRVDRREDVVFQHDKDSTDIRSSKQDRLVDLRNNLMLAQKFLPANLRKIYHQDWRQRYEALAKSAGKLAVFKTALRARRAHKHQANGSELSPQAIESIFELRKQSIAVGEWARRCSVWRVVLAEFGKNIYATYNACHASGLQIRCIADENSAYEGVEYRGLPVVPYHRAFEGAGIDGVVITNINPAQVESRARSIRGYFRGPILKLWEPPLWATNVKTIAA